jgi:HEAT repeat protein
MVFGLFSKDRAVKKAISKATSKTAQSVDRWAAMERLAQVGTDEALHALCQRFSFSYDKTSEDQQEKGWVVQTLVAKGEAALGPLRRYIKSASALGYPLEILGRIAPSSEIILETIDAILGDEAPEYTRDPKRKIDVIDWLAEWDGVPDDVIAERIIPYLEDFDEGVRFKATEALARKPSSAAGPPLAVVLINEEEESMRLKRRVAEVLADNNLELGEHKTAVAALLDEELTDFKLHKGRLARK